MFEVSKPYGTHADINALDAQVEARYISRRDHPTHKNIVIYNYTPRAVYDNAWNDETLQARGLIVDHETGLILGRPMVKFFNCEQIGQLPWNTPFEVTTKMDGSMFMLVRPTPDMTLTATRGAFTSVQAQCGRDIFKEKYSHVELDPEVTYIFEMIHPNHRIVLDYHGMEDIVLLAMIETATGIERKLDSAPPGLTVVKIHSFENIQSSEELQALETPDEEGFVVRFASGLRAKIKFSEYKHLHAIVTQTTSKSIWRALRDGDNIEYIIDKIPDEFYAFVQEWVEKLRNQYAEIENLGKSAYESSPRNGTKKEQAAHIIAYTKGNKCAEGVAFALLTGKTETYPEAIWRNIEPEYTPSPFADIN